MSVLKLSRVLLYSFKQSYSVIRAHFLILQWFFLLVLCCRINTRWLHTTEQWTSSVKRSGEMQGFSSFLLKAGFEGEIVQRSKFYTLDSLLLTLVFFVDFLLFLDTKEWGDFIKDWFLMFSDEIPNKRAPRFKTCLDDSEWFAGRSFLKLDTLSTGYIFIQWIKQLVSIIHIHWIMIYLVYCAVENLNNWGQNCNVNVADRRTAALILFNSKLGRHTWKISADIKATVREKSQKTKSQEAAYEDELAAAIGLFMSLLLSSHPVLCMISETKKTVDHTTWETFPIFFQ